MSRRVLTGVAAALATGAAAATIALAVDSSANTAAEQATHDASAGFLARYVLPNGRVIRRDQGGDTVSEGQAYALLLAQVAGDEATFKRVWHWTHARLGRPDGLFAFRADAHGVRDRTPATDADLLAAWALMRGPSRYHAAGRRVASAVLNRETAAGSALAAGPWGTGHPATINPSYFAFGAMTHLANANRRWNAVASRSLALVDQLTAHGRLLPPDWARIDGGHASPTPPADKSVPDVRYGLDAQRTLVWLAASCNPRARRLAARAWPILSRPGRASALALDQHGNVRVPTAHPLPLVAAAAAASAAGRPADRDRLLQAAADQDAAHPTYYGAAWVGLGRALLTTRTLGGCAQGGGKG
jgi:endo-1,4-beta-D-glucanase Y